MKMSKWKKNSGFTLLEVLIGTAILSMMVFMIWQVSTTTLDSQDRVQRRDLVYQMARVAIERLTDDLNMAFLVSNKDLVGMTKEGSKIETAFVGDDKGNMDMLNFNSFSHWRMFRNIRESDQCEIGYYVEQDEEEREYYRLMRRESPYLDDDIEEGGKAFPVAEGIQAFEASYYDGRAQDWTENWNSREVDQKNKMPRAVRLKLSFPDPDVEDGTIDFETIVFIELWQFPIEF